MLGFDNKQLIDVLSDYISIPNTNFFNLTSLPNIQQSLIKINLIGSILTMQ